jgi:conjugal transfer pilus assembly protein TraE
LKLSDLTRNWEATKTANAVLLGAVVVLSLSNIYLTIRLSESKIDRVLIPPMLTEQVRVGYAMADDAFYKSWGLYVAELVGNLTPGSAPFVAKALARLFPSPDAATVRESVLAKGRELDQNGAVSFFKADQLVHEPATSRVFVAGVQRQMSPSGAAMSVQNVTYEMSIEVRAGQPVITNLKNYEGEPRTSDWVAKHPDFGKAKPAKPASSEAEPS